jgi:hypothetical protein
MAGTSPAMTIDTAYSMLALQILIDGFAISAL